RSAMISCFALSGEAVTAGSDCPLIDTASYAPASTVIGAAASVGEPDAAHAATNSEIATAYLMSGIIGRRWGELARVAVSTFVPTGLSSPTNSSRRPPPSTGVQP